MSETTQYLLFFGLLWGSAVGAWLWIRWRMRRDARAERNERTPIVEPDQPWPRA